MRCTIVDVYSVHMTLRLGHTDPEVCVKISYVLRPYCTQLQNGNLILRVDYTLSIEYHDMHFQGRRTLLGSWGGVILARG
jgi:hypothetical protein